jgi:hypothetical protein
MEFSAASLADNPLTDTDSNYFAVWSRDGIKNSATPPDFELLTEDMFGVAKAPRR